MPDFLYTYIYLRRYNNHPPSPNRRMNCNDVIVMLCLFSVKLVLKIELPYINANYFIYLCNVLALLKALRGIRGGRDTYI